VLADVLRKAELKEAYMEQQIQFVQAGGEADGGLTVEDLQREKQNAPVELQQLLHLVFIEFSKTLVSLKGQQPAETVIERYLIKFARMYSQAYAVKKEGEEEMLSDKEDIFKKYLL